MKMEDLKFPPDWREVDIENVKKIAFLEAKFAALEKKVLAEADNLSDLFKHVNDTRKDVVRLAEVQNYMVRKLDEVYYHVFPDRLAQDNHVEGQLGKLFGKPEGDAGTKGS